MQEEVGSAGGRYRPGASMARVASRAALATCASLALLASFASWVSRRSVVSFASFASLTCIALLPAAPARAQPVGAAITVDTLGWLAGCWAGDGAEAGSTEQWLAPAAGTMFGIGRSVRAGRLSQFEFMAIRTTADGRLVFTAWPGGRNATDFPARAVSAGEAVFESGRTEFPNRVIYRRTGERTMLGRIEGHANGETRAVDFPFTRVACPEGR